MPDNVANPARVIFPCMVVHHVCRDRTIAIDPHATPFDIIRIVAVEKQENQMYMPYTIIELFGGCFFIFLFWILLSYKIIR